MSRVRFKGGAWTNSEDEVLRASLTVYGMQNWERVASMLVRKTAAQCRERWENYLDPRLHIREEWTAEEEEQLVQLQSLFANQWNLIARELRHRSGMNRPAWLCEEHYSSLLDTLEYERQRKDGKGNYRNDSMTLEDFLQERKRHRMVHQGHETRAAKPDAVNSEVFEKEMVEFAVSRLANQDGKKGLRKERKKQLEHTSFLAKLQSNRESIESGTLSAKAKKRMERAMMEDRSGPKDMLLQDNIIEEGGAEEEENENDEKEDGEGEDELNRRQQQRRRFQPIDLGADKQEAGIQAKQRVLVKDLSVYQMHLQDNSSVSDGVNMELLRLASGTSTTTPASFRLGEKKGIPLLHGNEKSGSDTAIANHSDPTNLDQLFFSLPDVVKTTHKTSKQAETRVNDPLDNLLTLTPHFGDEAVENNTIPGFKPPGTVSQDITPIASRVPVQETPVPLDFSTPAGHMLLETTKKRVLLEAKRMFLGCKRQRSAIQDQASPSDDKGDLVSTGMEMDEDDENLTTRRLVRALVASQLPSTARDLLREKIHSKYAVMKITEDIGSESSDEKEDKESEAVVRANLTLRVAETQAEGGHEFWKDVDTTEAIKELKELVHHQREHVTAVTEKDTAAQKNTARILAISFADGISFVYNHGDNIDSAFRHACVYWGSQLQDAQRQLAFYTAIREKECQEIRHRLDNAKNQLQNIEQKEMMLQGLYRSTRLGQNAM